LFRKIISSPLRERTKVRVEVLSFPPHPIPLPQGRGNQKDAIHPRAKHGAFWHVFVKVLLCAKMIIFLKGRVS
jgi:hypothetical protein